MSTFSRLLKLMLPFRWWVALAVLLSFATMGASVGLMAMSAYLISKAALVTGFADLAVAVTFVRGFAIARAALRYAERYFTHRMTFRVLTRLRVWFYTAVEPLAPARLQGYHSGDLLTRIVTDIETLDQFYVRVIVPPVAAALITGLSFVILGAFDWLLGLVLVGFLFLTGLLLPLLTRTLSKPSATQMVARRSQLNTAVTDEIQGMADLLAFDQMTLYQSRTLRLSDELESAHMRLAVWRGLSNALAVLLATLAGLTVLIAAIPLVTNGQIEGVFLALLPLTAIVSFEAVQPLGTALQQLETSQAAARRLFELIDTKTAVVESVTEPVEVPADNSLEFRHVSFRYAPNEPLVLDDVSFSIPAGGKLFISGMSGTGKSTIVNVLLRFWEVQAGQILIGGKDAHTFHPDDWRKLIGVASQQIHLFNGTIRDNLLLAKGDATDEELKTACEVAQVQPFIASLPHGYDTQVGENGLKLSGGERQRLSIARVILKAAPILVLDEVTANLDALTEQKVMKALADFMQKRTTIIISHRQMGLTSIDQVFEMTRGTQIPKHI
ncbi:MAG: thiol reductant ABC exporter subunit CydC [Anaerolineales bacterium]|nr:thiol reductant ABC exporter subunit CydC [Anaerolineales bacterium]